MKSATAKLVSPCPGDPEYVVVVDQDGNEFSPTLCGAANLLGYVPEGDFAEGNRETARVAWDAVGKLVGMTAEEAAAKAMDIATDKLKVTVDSLIEDYDHWIAFGLLAFLGGRMIKESFSDDEEEEEDDEPLTASAILASVFAPAMPSAERPFLRWKFMTAASVMLP